jgi:UDP-N-acetylmuramyl pentapeptide phosphotransferase/UDP-N-acetylglucosamine-1-phosphate transferase
MPLRIALALAGTFALACGVSALLVPPVIRLCVRRGWLAYPGGRRLHPRPTPKVGGIAIYAGFVAAVLASFGLGALLPAFERSGFETLRIGLVLVGGTLIFLAMWLDDVRELSPGQKLAAQLAAALIAVGPFLWDQTLYQPGDQARGIILTAFNFPFAGQVNLYTLGPWLAILATLAWVVVMENTVNLSDGIDGLAVGVSLIGAVALALNALRQPEPQYTIALLPLALAGACAGFLVFNFPPARIFMGDSGAEFLGYVLALSAIIGGAKLATVLLVLGVPILDALWLAVSRTLSGRSPAQAGRDHLHYRMLDLGFSTRQVVVFYYALAASFGLLGISDVTPLIKLAALLLLATIVIGALVYVARRAPAPTR